MFISFGLLLLLSLGRDCQADPSGNPIGPQPDYYDETEPKPVSVDLYYESLCPYSQAFIKDVLAPAFQDLKNSGKWLFTNDVTQFWPFFDVPSPSSRFL